MANSILTFGKHRGKDIEDVPSNYLEWLVQQNFMEDDHAEQIPIIESELTYRTDHDAHFVE